ncbi:MAG: hypothetical protein ACR2PR_11135 [Pseudohongiellaceae bacterium]
MMKDEDLLLLITPHPMHHKELGSLEGTITKIGLDTQNRPLVWLRSRLDGAIVKCIVTDKGLETIAHLEVEVLLGIRVRVHGLLHYKSLKEISKIEVDGIHIFKPDSELPNAADIVSPNFTEGVEASAYLKALREND